MVASSSRFVGTVRDLASDGRGVVTHPSGLTVFVSGVWLDEECLLELETRKTHSGSARLIEILKPAAERIVAPCRFHGSGPEYCGGCPWQFVRYSAQLDAKQRRIEKMLRAIGAHHRLLTIQASPLALAYRNRAQLKTNGTQLGFLGAKSRQLVDVDSCPVLTESNQQTLSRLRQHLPRSDWMTTSGELNSIHIDDALCIDEYSLNRRLPFRQGNDAQNDFMRHWLAQKLSAMIDNGRFSKNDQVVELFCGDGNLTETIASSGFSDIVAVDVVEDATSRLQQKNLPGVTVRSIDLYTRQGLESLTGDCRPAVLVLDPPRDGFPGIQQLLSSGSVPQDVFYVSCDPATLVRDIEILLRSGFKTREIQPVDLFPQTPHIETLVHLRRKHA